MLFHISDRCHEDTLLRTRLVIQHHTIQNVVMVGNGGDAREKGVYLLLKRSNFKLFWNIYTYKKSFTVFTFALNLELCFRLNISYYSLFKEHVTEKDPNVQTVTSLIMAKDANLVFIFIYSVSLISGVFSSKEKKTPANVTFCSQKCHFM